MRVPSDVSFEAKFTVTFANGFEVRTIEKVACPPFSAVGPLMVLTLMPAESSSMLVTRKSIGVIAAYAASVLVVAEKTIEYGLLPSA